MKKHINRKKANPSFSISDDSSSYESEDSMFDNHHKKMKSLVSNKNVVKSRAPAVSLINTSKSTPVNNLYSIKKTQNQKWTNYMSDSSDFSDFFVFYRKTYIIYHIFTNKTIISITVRATEQQCKTVP